MGWYVIMKPSVITEESDTPIGQMCIDVFGSGWGSFKIAHMQFVEIPNGIVFTTEYSVLGAIHAVKKFVKPSLVVPPMYFGQYHPLTRISVARALAR